MTESNANREGAQLVGYSPKIQSPAFDSYSKNMKRGSSIFTLILAAIAIVGFPIYGAISGDIDMPDSLYYGMGIGGMFVVIFLFQSVKKGRDTTWDGTVADKKRHQRTKHEHEDDPGTPYTEYEMRVRRDSGKIHKHTFSNETGAYAYYNIGDRVRHHKGFDLYEKYDKSQDHQILCIACSTMNNMEGDECSRCRCPLLK